MSRSTMLRTALFGAALVIAASCSSNNNRGSRTMAGDQTAAGGSYDQPAMDDYRDPAMEAGDQTASSGQECAGGLANAEVRPIDTADGVAIAFSTPLAGDVEALRMEVHRMAGDGAMNQQGTSIDPHGSTSSDLYGQGTGRTGMDQGTTGTTAMGSSTESIDTIGGVEVEATVSDTSDGAVITFRPKNQSELATLRGEVRRQATAMQGTECPDAVSLR